MASDICLAIIEVLNRHWHPLTSQKYIDEYCDDKNISVDDMIHKDLGQFLLFFIKKDFLTSRQHYKKYRKTVVELSSLVNGKVKV